MSLPLIDALLGRDDMADYQLADAARADVCRRPGRTLPRASAFRGEIRAQLIRAERRRTVKEVWQETGELV
jgi:RNA polymerase sigma-70 factor, ECF subfamily